MSWFRSLNLIALALCFCVVVFGAYVRLSDAGLGCPDWPGCYGHLTVPEARHEVASAEQNFPQRPVEAHKAWKEMIHRYLASTLGLLIVALALTSTRLRAAGTPRVLPWMLVALVVFQGMLGMWTVTWQLKPLVVTGHLLGGLSTLALLLWLALRTRPQADAGSKSVPDRAFRSERHAALSLAATSPLKQNLLPPGLRAFAALALVAVAMQIFLGGWTSTNYAALACPDFPTCQGSYLPDTDAAEAFTLWRGLGINYEHGVLDARARVTIHYFHRVGALVVTVLLLGLGSFLLRRGGTPLWRGFGFAVLAALALQVGLGITIVELQLPLLLAAAHNAGAAILLLTLISLNYFAWNAKPQ